MNDMNNMFNRTSLFLIYILFAAIPPAGAGGMSGEGQERNYRDSVKVDESTEHPLSAKDEKPVLFADPFMPFWEISGYVGYLGTTRTPIIGSSNYRWKNTDQYNIGLRATKWETASRGWQLDYRNFQLTARPSSLVSHGALAIKLNSINSFSLTRVFSFPQKSLFDATPYVAIGGGVDYIKSTIISMNNASLSNSEFGGINYGLQIGLRRNFNDSLSGFIEARALQHSVSLDWGSVSFSSNIPVLNLNIGLGYRF